MEKRGNRKKTDMAVEWTDKRETLSAEDEPVLTYEIHLPKLEGKRSAWSRIDRCYQKMACVWERRWKEEVFSMADRERQEKRAVSRQFLVWNAWLKGEITKFNKDILSVRMEAGEIRGNGRPCLMRWGEIWDLATGAPRPAGDFFPGRRKWKREVLPEILEQGRSRRAAGDCFLDQGWEERVGKLIHWWEPCLTEKGLEFYLPQCALTPPAEGVPAFVVSLAK